MLKIGGKEFEPRFLYRDAGRIFRRYDAYYKIDERFRKRGRVLDWAPFIFWALWIMIEKRGRWLWRKPFRSPRALKNAMLWEEYEPNAAYITNAILGVKAEGEKKEADPH